MYNSCLLRRDRLIVSMNPLYKPGDGHDQAVPRGGYKKEFCHAGSGTLLR
jgi:hypothetical protein